MVDRFVWVHQFGTARVSVISEATGCWPRERAVEGVPEEVWRAEVDVTADDCLEIGFNLMHVSFPGASILIDTGFGQYDPTNPANPLVSVKNMRMSPGAAVGLAQLGVRPDEITDVFITHMHGDHILGATKLVGERRVPTYPNARYHVMEAEWAEAPAFHQNAAAINAQKETLQSAGVVELAPGDRESRPGVSFLFAPGESAGHAIVRIETGAGVIYNVGDLFHYPAEFHHLDWRPRFREQHVLQHTREKYLPRFVAENAWIFPAHHRFPTVGRVEEMADGYHWATIEPGG